MNNDLAFTKPCRKDLCHFLFDKSKFVVLLLISLLLLFQHCHRLTLRPGVHLFAFADSCHIKSKPDLGKKTCLGKPGSKKLPAMTTNPAPQSVSTVDL